MKKMIILTGAAGFIGSCYLWKLNQEGFDQIILVDEKLNPVKEKNIANKRYEDFIEKDIFLDLVKIDKIGSKIDAVIHMGACSSTTLQDADYFEKNNTEYSKSLAVWAFKKKARFIYASSAATYGDGSLGFSDEDDNSRRLIPLNLYGLSKQKFDLWVLDNNLQGKCVGLKFFNVFGPNEYHKGAMASVLQRSFKKVLAEKKMRLFKSYKPEYPDGGQKRDFIYVKDAAEVMHYFFQNRNKNGIFNLGTGKAQSWNDLADALFQALDMKPCIEYFDMPEDLRPRYQYFTQAELKKLRQAGYEKDFMPLKDSVKDYVGYLKKDAYL